MFSTPPEEWRNTNIYETEEDLARFLVSFLAEEMTNSGVDPKGIEGEERRAWIDIAEDKLSTLIDDGLVDPDKFSKALQRRIVEQSLEELVQVQERPSLIEAE